MQWEDIGLPSTKCKVDESDEAKTYTKTVITAKKVQVGEVLDEFQETFAKVKQHQNTKQIQAVDFQHGFSTCGFSYQCELQNEIMGAIWTRGSVNLFTCAVYNNSQQRH